MQWVVFSYSLSSQAGSSARVAVWRRLRRLGTVSPAGGIHVLPAQDECVEAFQWLAQEVQQAQGEALILHVERFEGISDAQLVERFRRARAKAYAAVEAQVANLERRITARSSAKNRMRLREQLSKLCRQHAEIARVDFFDTPEGTLMASRLARLEQSLSPVDAPCVSLSAATAASYRGKRWVTQPRLHVDRLACIWLIRRFIDPDAVIRYTPPPEPDEIAFAMPDGTFGHWGNLCTFETMVAAFGLEDASLHRMGEIVHEIDLRDGRYVHPETAVIDAVLKGWLLMGFSDLDLEVHGVALFEGLYTAFARGEQNQPPRQRT
jgi:hypothetical protein